MNRKRTWTSRWPRATGAYLGKARGAAVFYELAERPVDPLAIEDVKGRTVTEAFGSLPLGVINDGFDAWLADEDGGTGRRHSAFEAAVQDLLQFSECFGPIGVGWREQASRSSTPVSGASSRVAGERYDLITTLVKEQQQLRDTLALVEAGVRQAGSAADLRQLVESMDRHLRGVRLRVFESSSGAGTFEIGFEVRSLMQVIYLEVLDYVRSSPANGVGNCAYCGGPVLRSRSAMSPNANAWHRGCANAGRLAKVRERKGGKRKE